MSEAWRPTNKELIEYSVLSGTWGVYHRAFDAGVEAVRAELRKAEEFEDRLYQIVKAMGFTGLGSGQQGAILQALEALALSRRSSAPMSPETGDTP